MTILDEREPSVSLKLIVVVVSVATLAAFASLYALNAAQATVHHVPAPVSAPQPDTGNL